MNQSFLTPELTALAAAIENDPTLQGLLAGDKVYSGLAPQGAPYDHVTLGNATDSEHSMFGTPGAQGVVTINIWTLGPGLMGVAAIYDALKALLHGTVVPLTNVGTMCGKMSLVLNNLGDPSDPRIVRGVANYTVWSHG